MADVHKLAVVGAGQMGSGIAQVGAQVGLDVVLVDVSAEAVDKGLAKIRRDLERQVKKGRLTETDKGMILGRLRGATNVADAAGADFAVEAVSESEPIKKEIFRALDGVLPPHAVLATNTSSISVTRIATVTKRPAQVIGMHFMNPVPAMKLVELVRGAETSDATYAATHALALRMGKTTVATRDFPAFIVNRLLIPYLNEACFAVMEGLGTVPDIDTAMKLGTNVPMGPLELADFIGLDTVLSICNVLHEGMGDDKYRASPLLRQYVDAGWLGKKSGRGFYQYDAEGNKA